jgi:plasmid stabilization system protein ParE
MTTIVVVDEAEQQLRDIDEWWRANRPEATTLVVDEFERCTTLLASSPDIGAGFHRTSVPGVRRLLMKTRHFVYYVHCVIRADLVITRIGDYRCWYGGAFRHETNGSAPDSRSASAMLSRHVTLAWAISSSTAASSVPRPYA